MHARHQRTPRHVGVRSRQRLDVRIVGPAPGYSGSTFEYLGVLVAAIGVIVAVVVFII